MYPLSSPRAEEVCMVDCVEAARVLEEKRVDTADAVAETFTSCKSFAPYTFVGRKRQPQ